MSARYRFSLTANDEASGTSSFEIVPAPGAIALLGMGGLLAARRRRH
jgi:MYXO-CTERM domain-containing protein